MREEFGRRSSAGGVRREEFGESRRSLRRAWADHTEGTIAKKKSHWLAVMWQLCVCAKCFAVRIDNCDTSAKLFKDANCCLKPSCTSSQEYACTWRSVFGATAVTLQLSKNKFATCSGFARVHSILIFRPRRSLAWEPTAPHAVWRMRPVLSYSMTKALIAAACARSENKNAAVVYFWKVVFFISDYLPAGQGNPYLCASIFPAGLFVSCSNMSTMKNTFVSRPRCHPRLPKVDLRIYYSRLSCLLGRVRFVSVNVVSVEVHPAASPLY